LIDQTLIRNNTSSGLHNFESPSCFEFPEHVGPQRVLKNHVFDNYSSIPELNVRINLSLIDPVQYEIFDLDSLVLITKNLNYAEHNNFANPHKEITANEHPITTQSIGNNELIQEPLSSQFVQILLKNQNRVTDFK
jgi:hypothetical protein